MKNPLSKYTFILLCLLAASCVKDDTQSSGGVLSTSYVRDIFYDEVLAQADLNQRQGVTEVGFTVAQTPAPDIETGMCFEAEFPAEQRFTAYVNGLERNKKYYLRPYALRDDGSCTYGMEIIFRTSDIIVNYVTMGEAAAGENLSAKTLEVTGSVTHLGGATRLVEYGAYYWIKGDSSTKQKQGVMVPENEIIGANTPFKVLLQGLKAATEYEVQVYARNLRREQYAQAIEATTLSVVAPAVELTQVKNLTTSTAVVEGCITSLGNDPEAAFGIYFGTGTTPDQKAEVTQKELDEQGNYRFTALARGLKASTEYYFVTFVANDHSEVRSIVSAPYKTLPPGKPIIATTTVVNNRGIGSTTARLEGVIESDGGSALAEYGIKWGTSSANMTLLKASAYDEISGVYAVEATGLTGNTTYYFQAYAKNEYGETSGDLQTFRTGLNGGKQWLYDSSGKRFYQGGSELFYFELDPIQIAVKDLRTGSSRTATAYFLDRNLGATEAFPRIGIGSDNEIEWSEKYVGYFYQWGIRTPAMVYRISAGQDPATAMLLGKDVWEGNPAKLLTIGWNPSPAIPADDSWPEVENPCPEGYRIPDLFEWQATARAIAAQGIGNGNFNDIYKALHLGKTGYRQANGTRGKANIVNTNGSPESPFATEVLAHLWASTACKASGSRRIEVSQNVIPSLPVPAGAPFDIDNTSSTSAYHFSISDPTFNFGEVGRSWMMDTEYLKNPPSQTAFSLSQYYDPWQYYGSSVRQQTAGVPVRCVRIVYQ